MKIEKLEMNRIKVTLFLEDLQKYNINLKSIKPNSPEIHTFLCEVMRMVRSTTNFNPYDGQVVVEATPCGEELVLMVSKIEENVRKNKIDLKKVKHVKAVKKNPDIKCYICRLGNFNSFCLMVKNCGETVCKNAALYKLGEKFYIVYKSQSFDMRISEFSEVCRRGNVCAAYLKEHGELVAKGDKLCEIARYIINEK